MRLAPATQPATSFSWLRKVQRESVRNVGNAAKKEGQLQQSTFFPFEALQPLS